MKLAKLGPNTNKVKHQLLPTLAFAEIQLKMQAGVERLQCTKHVKDYVKGISAEELRGFFCKMLTIGRNFLIAPSSNWRGDYEPQPRMCLLARSKQIRKKRKRSASTVAKQKHANFHFTCLATSDTKQMSVMITSATSGRGQRAVACIRQCLLASPSVETQTTPSCVP